MPFVVGAALVGLDLDLMSLARMSWAFVRAL